MARKYPLTSLKQMSEINLTPLMDLTFILLITFIITFPLIEQGITVDLPKADAEDLGPELPQTVTIDEKGTIYFNEIRVTIEELNKQLGLLANRTPDAMVMVRADETITYGNVVSVLKVLHGARISRMALVTQEEK